jgi:multicomponent Na+:H+ antiporter subunit D
MIDSNNIIVFVLLPVMAAALMPVFERVWRELVDFLAVVVGAALVGLSVTFITPVRIYGSLSVSYNELLAAAQTFQLDSLSLLMLLVINVVGFLAIIYSIDYMRAYGSKGRFYALFLLMLAGMNGLVLSRDLFGLYLFMEVAACSSYALVAFGLQHDELEAAFKYLILSAAASALILLSIALIFSRTGDLNMRTVGGLFGLFQEDKSAMFVIVMFLVGFGLKMAMVPFHAWLPDAHPSAPAPVSAMLSGVLIKASGVYALMRILYNVVGIQSMPSVRATVMGMGILTIVVGAILALVQTDYKRLLAYSSISQIGYILLGFGIGTPLAFIGALYHLMNHATFKSLLFLVSGSVQQATGTRDLNRMGGLSKRMPITALTSSFGSLAISGVPPFNGFFSKTIIVIAAVNAGQSTGESIYYWYAVIAVLFSVVTLAYFLKTQRKAFFGLLREEFAQIKEARLAMTLPMIVLALLTLALGVAYPWLYHALLDPAAKVLSSAQYW